LLVRRVSHDIVTISPSRPVLSCAMGRPATPVSAPRWGPASQPALPGTGQRTARRPP
jgi:hypothetical protein